MKKTLLTLSFGFLISFTLLLVFAFQTEEQNKTGDVAIMRFNNGTMTITSGSENAKTVRLGPLAVLTMPENQQKLNDIMNDYHEKGYRLVNSLSLKDGNFTLFLEK